jgi:hypothetical protein
MNQNDTIKILKPSYSLLLVAATTSPVSYITTATQLMAALVPN